MKYFDEGRIERGYGEKTGIIFDRIFSISKNSDSSFEIIEECDGYYRKNLNKEQTLEMLTEAVEWINKISD